MARISYPDASRPELEPLVERIKDERGGKLLNHYKILDSMTRDVRSG